MLKSLRIRRNGLAAVFPLAILASGVTGFCGADERGQVAPLAADQVCNWIDALGDDRPSTRANADERISRICRHTDRPTRDRIRQHILGGLMRAGLNADLETQLHLERLLGELDEAQHRRDLDEFVRTQTDFDPTQTHGERNWAEESPRSSRLATHWQTFATRAGGDWESRRVFAQLADKAGPSWQWWAIATQTNDDCAIFVSHLGCVAPTEPHYHIVESRLVYQRLDQFEWADQTMSTSHMNARLLGRLIDRTLWDNPYGWTVEQRLRLALMYRRVFVAVRIADSVMRTNDRLPVDWAASMLAVRQIERRGFTGSGGRATDWTKRWKAISSSLTDQRLLARRPDEPTPRWKVPLFDDAEITTRVQDVAGWVLMDRDECDARQHGMPQLQADPIWGARRCSIGFATQYERERHLDALVKTHLSF